MALQAGNHVFMTKDKPPKKIVDSVVSQLLAVRKEKKLSHEKLAQLSKLHRSTISLTESRKMQPTLLTLLKISQALDCDLSRLLAKAEKD
jgi:transcriptional regulator with XRE-family HTH domain